MSDHGAPAGGAGGTAADAGGTAADAETVLREVIDGPMRDRAAALAALRRSAATPRAWHALLDGVADRVEARLAAQVAASGPAASGAPAEGMMAEELRQIGVTLWWGQTQALYEDAPHLPVDRWLIAAALGLLDAEDARAGVARLVARASSGEGGEGAP